MKNEIDWIIHCCSNGACGECGEIEAGYIPYACDAHTHGMMKYDHPDFQLVLFLPHQEIARILNTLSLRVQSGECFKAGDLISGIYEDCDVRLDEYEQCGRKVLRVVIPDKDNRFPEDECCTGFYRLQSLATDALYVETMNIRIYQIVPDEQTRHLIYEKLEFVKSRCAGRVLSEFYECIYAGEVRAKTLEDVFTIFNIRHPKGFRGRSMSTSDVVEVLSGNLESGFYYCNTFGFEKIAFEKGRCIGGSEDE